jgi:pantetheine-phosphate adenylyltransferase
VTAAPRVAVYPGSFDPITLGHMDILERAAKLFDRVIVAIGRHPVKHGWLDVGERCRVAAASAEHLPGVNVEAFDGLVVDLCRQRGASVIVRGLRATGDFEPEFQMGLANRDLVREIAGHGGDFEQYVTPVVAEAVRRRLGAGR